MCLLIALLLAAFGFFGVAGLRSEVTPPPVVAVEATAEAVPVATQAISCASVSEAEDTRDMLALVGDTFASAEWTQTTTSDAVRTTAAWRSSVDGAVAYVEMLHYDCGITTEQIKRLYQPSRFDTILSNYTSYTMTAQCTADGVRLFEFDAVFNDQDYHVLYWVEQPSPTRVAGLMLTFPAAEPAQQAEYAGRLMPELPTCEAAAG